MKKTGKIFTLRGTGELVVTTTSTSLGTNEYKLLSYSSPDQSRAWILRRAYAWTDNLIGTGGGDSRMLLQMCLSTDFLTPSAGGSLGSVKQYLSQYSPSDNRTIGWNAQDQQERDDGGLDFYLPSNAFKDTTQFIIDENRVITRDFYLNAYAQAEGAQITTNIHWLIELEEVVITPTESIIQQIKGISQDVG